MRLDRRRVVNAVIFESICPSNHAAHFYPYHSADAPFSFAFFNTLVTYSTRVSARPSGAEAAEDVPHGIQYLREQQLRGALHFHHHALHTVAVSIVA